jgi:hypothetical protein
MSFLVVGEAMNINEGARRMRKAGRWLIVLPLVLLTIVSVVGCFVVRYNPRFALGLIPISIPLLIPGVVLWLAGWIVEGFAKEGLKNSTLEH